MRNAKRSSSSLKQTLVSDMKTQKRIQYTGEGE